MYEVSVEAKENANEHTLSWYAGWRNKNLIPYLKFRFQ